MRIQGRPKKYRIVRVDPKIDQFSPRGKPGRPDQVDLGMDEFEALRLSDFMGFSQTEAAQSMRVSQQTFSRIIRKARKNLTRALVNGAVIKIQGGIYVLSTKEPVKQHKPTETFEQIVNK